MSSQRQRDVACSELSSAEGKARRGAIGTFDFGMVLSC